MSNRFRWFGALAFAALLGSCTDALVPGKIALDVGTGELEVGDTLNVQVAIFDATGNAIGADGTVLTSSNPAALKVIPPFQIVGVSAGEATLTAALEGETAVATVVVLPAVVRGVGLTPTNVRLLVGATAPLIPRLTDKRGNVLTDRTVTYASADPAIATVNSAGVVTAVGVGGTTVTGTVGDHSGSAAIVVILPVSSVAISAPGATLLVGDSAALAVTLRDANAAALADRSVTWTSSNPAVATVSDNGFVRAIGRGSVTITATSEGVSGVVSLSVVVPIVSVSVSPASITLLVGQSATITAAALDAGGTAVVGTPISFASSNTSVATVTAGGVVVGVAAGSTSISATAGGAGIAVPVTVSPVPVASVALSESSLGRLVGQTAQLFATPRDSAGGALDRSVVYSTSNAAIATVTASGRVSAITPGTATITAASEGRVASANFLVSPVPVSSVSVEPATAQINFGATFTLAAAALDSTGAQLGRPITWSTGDPAIATVSSLGVVTGMDVGTVSITATSEGKSASATITVVIPVNHVTVTPSPHTILAGQVFALTATPRDSLNRPLVRPVAWSTSNSGVVEVSLAGVLTGKVAGTATITVASGGKEATAAITVIPVPVASVTLAAIPALVVGSNVGVSATPRDSIGGILTNRTTVWTSSDPAIVTVLPDNRIVATTVGSATLTGTIEGKFANVLVTVIPVPVITVTVTPTSPDVLTGETVQLTATPRDSAGNPILDGRLITWNSSNNTFATVSVAGLVSAVARGAVTITATCEGKIGTASVEVISSLHPNEAPGLVQMLDVDFSSKDLGPGFSYSPSWAGPNIVAAPDLTGRRSPGGVIEYVYNIGHSDQQGSPGFGGKRFLDGGRKEIYLSLWLFIQRPWQYHGTGVNKIFFVGSNEQANSNAEIVCTVLGASEANSQFRCGVQGPLNVGAGTSSGYYTANRATPGFSLDAWHHVEVQFIGNTGGAPNGTMRWWIDGTMVGEHTNVLFNTVGDATFDATTLNPNWGGNMQSLKTQRDVIKFDHYYFSGKF